MTSYNAVDLRDCAADIHDADQEGICTVCGKTCLHGHVYGPVELALFTGNLHRRCINCRAITLDLEDDDE